MSGTVLGAGDSERQDRNSQLVVKTEMQYRGFCGGGGAGGGAGGNYM